MSPSARVAIAGIAYLVALLILVVSEARLGTSLFFACAGVAVAAYALVMTVAWNGPADRRLLLAGALFAVAFRVPLAFPPVRADNDMIRYVWDGRVQKLGINPYAVRPADEPLAFTHNDETRHMPSARQRTPYPPAAQLFFRFVVTLHDSGRAMKLALIGCDLLVMAVVWRWLVVTGRSEWLTLAYGWNPLVVLEVAHSGHIDVLAALWIVTCAFWLTRRRTALATVAFVLAVATKFLPIVLAPLLWRRVTPRDMFVGAGLFVLLYLPFSTGADVLFGVQNVIQHIRFNGPLFRVVSQITSPDVAARVAVSLGLLTAVWCRWKLSTADPAAWAWPMAVAIAFAPVVYPWYLLSMAPFLLTPAVLPLTAWSCSVLPAYVVWEIARSGGRWVVPAPVLVAEYGMLAVALFLTWVNRERLMALPASRSRK